MGLSQTSGSWKEVVISALRVITTPFIVMLDLNPNNGQIYLKWVLGVSTVDKK
jgi:hypothetical protein